MTLRNIYLAFGKYLTVRVKVAEIPPYITIGVLVVIVIIAYIQEYKI